MTLSSQSEGPGLRGVSPLTHAHLQACGGDGQGRGISRNRKESCLDLSATAAMCWRNCEPEPRARANLKWLKRCGISDSEDNSYRFTPQC